MKFWDLCFTSVGSWGLAHCASTHSPCRLPNWACAFLLHKGTLWLNLLGQGSQVPRRCWRPLTAWKRACCHGGYRWIPQSGGALLWWHHPSRLKLSFLLPWSFAGVSEVGAPFRWGGFPWREGCCLLCGSHPLSCPVSRVQVPWTRDAPPLVELPLRSHGVLSQSQLCHFEVLPPPWVRALVPLEPCSDSVRSSCCYSLPLSLGDQLLPWAR